MRNMKKYFLMHQFRFEKQEESISHLVIVALPDINEVDRSEPCSGKRPPCQLCSSMKNTNTFKSDYSNEIYQINKTCNCNSKMVVHLIEFQFFGQQYNSSSMIKFRARANNYKSTHRNF